MDLVDWRLAAATARRLVPAGPSVTRAEADAAVEQLRTLAVEADQHVRQFSRLDAGGDAGRVLVVDRPGWIEANVEGFQVVLQPFVAALTKRRRPSDLAVLVGSRVTALELGGILSFLATKVLGQYEVFLPPDQLPGRLTLVAPNIVATERQLHVDPRDFRMWVCLHEMAHRAQFTAVPWLREHIEAQLADYAATLDIDPITMLRRFAGGVGAAVSAARRGEFSLLELVQSPDQRVILDRLTAVMSLLEGHAEWVMDGVGPEVVPTVAEIRRRFDVRRHELTPLDRVMRQILGLDAKMRQYVEGSAFVRAAVDHLGVDTFNVIWSSREMLPTRAEIRDPEAWVARVAS